MDVDRRLVCTLIANTTQGKILENVSNVHKKF